MCCHLRSNNTLKSLSCDSNSITYAGYLSFRHMLNHNTRFKQIEWPVNDLEIMGKNNPKYRQVLCDIYRICKNRVITGLEELNDYGFKFDLMWPTPMTKPAPLVDIPTDIKQDLQGDEAIILDLAYVDGPIDDDLLFSPLKSARIEPPAHQRSTSDSEFVENAQQKKGLHRSNSTILTKKGSSRILKLRLSRSNRNVFAASSNSDENSFKAKVYKSPPSMDIPPPTYFPPPPTPCSPYQPLPPLPSFMETRPLSDISNL